MIHEYIDGAKLKEMFYSSAQLLEKNKQKINSLNVFPVPDGDTGTNMSLTMQAAVKEVLALPNGDISMVVEAVSKGALKGARGNSGVILSQIFRGFAKGLKGEKAVSTRKFAEALKLGADTSYKAVMKPVEGTMLTVIRVTAEEALKLSMKIKDFEHFFSEIVKVAKNVLDKTPEMLNVLKQAGVVDSGGMGIVFILMGAANALKEDFDMDIPLTEADVLSKPALDFSQEGLDEIAEGYCTEFLIKNVFSHIKEEDVTLLSTKLSRLGDSLVVVSDDDLIKIHIHTNVPGKILQLALRFGELSGIKIDNMREQHHHLSTIGVQSEAKKPTKKYGFVAVASGEGIVSVFSDLGVDQVVEGGQTMNPSIEDLLKAVEKIDAENVFILPNNSNIILSANQLGQLVNGKLVHVVPSKSIPQGIAAMVAFNADNDESTNFDRMADALENIKTGLVTYAVRDSVYNGLTIKSGNILGICESDIKVAGDSIIEVTKELVSNMINANSDIVTIFTGAEVKKEEVSGLKSFIVGSFPQVDLEVYPGNQPIYYFIISVE